MKSFHRMEEFNKKLRFDVNELNAQRKFEQVWTLIFSPSKGKYMIFKGEVKLINEILFKRYEMFFFV